MTVRQRLLTILEMNRGETISGEWLAGELGCTRSAVWKAVKTLREEGYQIEAGPNRGYLLPDTSARLSGEAIAPLLKQKSEVFYYPMLDSTNRIAKQLCIEGKAVHGTVIVTAQQTAGRGRRGRAFFSPEGNGIYMSVVLQPDRDMNESLLLTTGAAVAVLKAVEEVCGISLQIKWVNDLYLEGKKVCGILTEAITDFESGIIEYAIVGIGLNLTEPDGGYPEKIREIAGALYADPQKAQKLNPNLLAARITDHLLEETRELKLSPVYVERNMIPGHRIRIQNGEEIRYAKALEITPQGRLLIQEENGEISRLSYGEVSIRTADETDAE